MQNVDIFRPRLERPRSRGSEWGQAMDIWLELVRDYEELVKEKKARDLRDRVEHVKQTGVEK